MVQADNNDAGTANRDRRLLLQAAAILPVTLVAASVASAQSAPALAARNVFVSHAFPEKQVDLGEVKMNYAEAGSPAKPALLLIPGQTESWWGYEAAMKLLEKDFHVFAVDLRGQGQSSWTPKRYSLDIFGNDLVRFIALAVKKPVIVSGNSSGGVLSAWLSAFAMPGQIRAALYEDPPLFSSELVPAFGHSIRQSVGGSMLLVAKDYLGDQWSVGDWQGFRQANKNSVAPLLPMMPPLPDAPPQNLKEYDPEWARAFCEGTVGLNCPHERMLTQVKTPVLLTHHARMIDPKTGILVGALSDFQAEKVRELVASTGNRIDYRSLPDAAHPLHAVDPPRYVKVLTEWAATLPRV